MTDLSLARVHAILKKHLKVRKINARWIPHLLSDEQKKTRVTMAKNFSKCTQNIRKKAFDNKVTGDETWVYNFEPKRKVASQIWATKKARCPGIAKRIHFFTNKSPANQISVPKGRTVTGKFYKNVVLRKLKNYYKSRRPKTGLKYVRLLHDNAPAHKARIVTDFLESEKVTVLLHPLYSPDLAPCDYFLFPKLKYHLSGRRYNSRNALGSAVYQCLMGVPIEEYEKFFQKWIDRLKRCVAGGEYFEGQSKLK